MVAVVPLRIAQFGIALKYAARTSLHTNETCMLLSVPIESATQSGH
jgi:hypothetical protein